MALPSETPRDTLVTFLPHRLNRQPVVVRGLTADELWICAGLSGAAGCVLGLPLAWLTHVFDTQAGDMQHRSFPVLKRGGVLVSIAGKPDGRLVREFGLNPLLGVLLDFLSRKSLRLAKRHGVRYEYLFMHPSGEQLAQIGRLLAEGSVRTIIDKVFPLEQGREALTYSEAGHATGKVVVEVKAAG